MNIGSTTCDTHYSHSKVLSIQQREKGLSSAKMKILERGQRTHNTHNRLPVCVDSEFSTLLRSMHTVMLHHYTQQYMVYLNKSSPSQHASPEYYHYHYLVCCYGGSQDVSNTARGHVVFLRNTNKGDEVSTDQLNHIRYWREIFLPYVKATRAHYLRQEGWEEGNDAKDENFWVVWQVISRKKVCCCCL